MSLGTQWSTGAEMFTRTFKSRVATVRHKGGLLTTDEVHAEVVQQEQDQLEKFQRREAALAKKAAKPAKKKPKAPPKKKARMLQTDSSSEGEAHDGRQETDEEAEDDEDLNEQLACGCTWQPTVKMSATQCGLCAGWYCDECDPAPLKCSSFVCKLCKQL